MQFENDLIKNLAALASIVEDVNKHFDGQVWWRGQRNISWKLQPHVYRIDGGDNYEQNIARLFKRRSPLRAANAPDPDDNSSWLFLMQHHGLPTRLLDWTESPLFACYFAVQEEDRQEFDGSLFALSPIKLNFEQAQVNGIFLPEDGLVKRAIDNALVNPADFVNYIIGMYPYELQIRVMAQLSVFTLHGIPQPLDEISNNHNFLMKFRIPKEFKNDLRSQLKNIGVREGNLFPDWDHLSKEIKELRFRKSSKAENPKVAVEFPPTDDDQFHFAIGST